MTKTRSASTSEPSIQERRSSRLARDVENSRSTKLKRNSLDLDGFVRASPRRKVAKFSSDSESIKKDPAFTPHKKYLNTPSKHFTRSSKRIVSSVNISRSNINGALPCQSPTRGRKKPSGIGDSPVMLLTKVEHCTIQPQNILRRTSSLQENGSSVYENGSATQNECKHLSNRTLRGRQCQCSSVGVTDRPVTRLSLGREETSSNRLSNPRGMKNSLELKSEMVDASVDVDCKLNGCQEKEGDSLASQSRCRNVEDGNVSIQEESKEQLDIEELLEIEYSDIAGNDFVGFQGKRKMNLRSSGVHCDPNYYSLSLELLKKSRCKSVVTTFTGKEDKLGDSPLEKSINQAPERKVVENETSLEDTNNFASGETISSFPEFPDEGSKKDCQRKANHATHEELNGITSTMSQLQADQDNAGDMCNFAAIEPKNSVANRHSKDDGCTTNEIDLAKTPIQSNSENVHIGTEYECSSEDPIELVPSIADPNESPKENKGCDNEAVSTKQVNTSKQSPSLKRRRGNFKQRSKEAAIEKPKIQMLFRDPSEPPPLFTEEAIPKSDVYYFESDHVALKHNKDYQGLLKTVALLEAQRHQCLHDIESLRLDKDAALGNPVAFVDKLQTDSRKPSSCKPQSVATLPNIDWQKYSSQYGTFSNVFGNDSASNKPVTRNLKIKFESGIPEHSLPADKETNKTVLSQSTRVTWTVDEQLKLEELLLKFPSEPVEFNRFRKIAAALGNRTPLQVQSRVQKYFIKLARAGLPVPGVMPRSSRRVRDSIRFGQTKRARTHPQQSYLRASTFFPQLHCPVQMAGDDGDIALPSTSNICATNVASGEISDDEDIPEILRDSEEYNEILRLKKLRKSKLYISDDSVRQTLAQHTGYACDMCDSDPIMGVRYHCIDCPRDTCVDLCQSCIHLHGQFVTNTHKPSHRMEPVYESQNFLDGDYMKFDSCSGEYNYLDPNFHPASI